MTRLDGADEDEHLRRNAETVRRLSDELDAQQVRVRVTRATRQEVTRLIGTDPVAELGIPEATRKPTAQDIVVCMRVPAAHTANSTIERCSNCGRRVWVAATTPPEPRRLCVECYGQQSQRAR